MKSEGLRKRSGPVTAEVVIDEALRLIDEEGLEALTMRRLAQEIGVEPVTIYRQLPNKEAILAGVAERLWATTAEPSAMAGPATMAEPSASPAGVAEDDWRSQVRGMWMGLHRLMQEHPNAIPVLARGGVYSASAGAGTVAMADVFRRGGLSPSEAAELLHIIGASVVGFGFATLWTNQAMRGEGPEAPAGESEPIPEALQPYLDSMAYWDPAHFERALDIALAAYGGRTPER